MARRPPKEAQVTAEQRAELLRLLGIGLEFRTSCEKAKVSVAAVRWDAKLYGEALDAYRLGNTKLRERAVELALGKEANATSRAALLDRMLDRRDAELARLEAAVPQPPAPPMTPKDDFLEQIARIFERQILNDPPKWLRAILGSVLSAGVVKLNAEAKAAAQRLHAILEGHPPAPYTEAWWALERAAGRNGSTGFAGYQRPARATAAGPMVRPEDRSKRVDDLGTLDAAAPIPPGHALVSVRPDRAPAPPEVMERWYGANWQDGPWGGR